MNQEDREKIEVLVELNADLKGMKWITAQMIAKLEDLPSLIHYLESTSEDEWQVDKVRNKDNSQNCIFGHLVNWAYGKDYEGDISTAWDFFEEMWCTTFEFYEINDGRDKRYPQSTSRERCIDHLKNLWLGIATPTWKGMKNYSEQLKETS